MTEKMLGISHLRHASDEAILGDFEGTMKLLESMHLSILGDKPYDFCHSIKFDGSVAIRVRKLDGVVEVSTKSGENKVPKVNRTVDDIQTNHGNRPGLVRTLTTILENIGPCIPDNGITYQGDVIHEDGLSAANTLEYLPVNPYISDRMKQTKIGIVFHSKTDEAGNVRLIDRLLINEGFFQSQNVHVIDPMYIPPSTQYVNGAAARDFQHIRFLHEQIYSRAHSSIVASQGVRMQKYLNMCRREDIRTTVQGYEDFVTGEFRKIIEPLKTEAGKNRRMDELHRALNEINVYKQTLTELFILHWLVEAAAQSMQATVDKSCTGGFYTKIGAVRVPGEGSVLVSDSLMIKVVPTEFTVNNARNMRYRARKE